MAEIRNNQGTKFEFFKKSVRKKKQKNLFTESAFWIFRIIVMKKRKISFKNLLN